MGLPNETLTKVVRWITLDLGLKPEVTKNMKVNMNRMAIAAVLFSLSAASFAGGHRQQKFTVGDLQKMVDELKPYLAEDPRLVYPIKCVVVDKDDVNANASFEFEKDAPKDAKPRAKMTVYTGLLDFMKDVRLVRAVVAHELSHLAKQHLGKGMKVQDLDLILTRQQEYEADATGAIALEKAGYSRKDMVDMLFKLGESAKDWPGAVKVLGDHADCARRAAAVGDNNLVLRSMVSFQNGEAYLDARKYDSAIKAFDKSSSEAPKFYESKYNAAQASLLNYYTNVAKNIVEGWYIPDFGPALSMPTWEGKAGVINDQDRTNYAIAQAHVKAVLDADPNRQESLELQGLLLVLDPDGKSQNLQDGIKALQAAMKKAMSDSDKLRIANNLALGYQRTGNVNDAIKTLMAVQRLSKEFNSYVAVNLGQQVPGDEFKGDAKKLEDALFTYLSNNPEDAQGYVKALATYGSLCSKYGLTARKIQAAPIYLSRVISLNHDGKIAKMLDPIEEILTLFGKPENALRYSDDYEGMKEYVWDGGKYSVITDSRKAGSETFSEVLRITSYKPGASIDILPKDRTVEGKITIKVGMTAKEFGQYLNPKGGISRSLVKQATIEEWTYFPGLNIGVLFKDDKVAGLTVSPVTLPQE